MKNQVTGLSTAPQTEEFETKYAFLTVNPASGLEKSEVIFVTYKSNIKLLRYSECYTDYGREIGAGDAGDWIDIPADADIDTINVFLEENDCEHIVESGQTVSAYETYELYELLEKFGLESEGITVEGFDYWDGSNWQTIITQNDYYEPDYIMIDDEELIAELTEAIENMSYEDEVHGRRFYASGKYAITESFWQDDWELYTITEKD